jgi:diguanylate cyclase (GGDEF)-like protein
MGTPRIVDRFSRRLATIRDATLGGGGWTAVPRRISYAVFGACLAQGVAAGLLLLHFVNGGSFSPGAIATELAGDLHTYAYIALSTTVAFALFGALVGRSADRLAQLASTAPLTGLLNARAFHSRLHHEIVRATRYRQPLSLLLVDLDGLKHVNDQHGHQAGDDALQRVAAAIGEGLRETDVGARVGGDEFAVIGPNSPRSAAVVLAERLRALVARDKGGVTAGRITVSIGIACFMPSESDVSSELALMRAADAALYQAKHAGGNAAKLDPQRAESQAKVIRPQQDREQGLPERQVQKPDRKQPCCKPQRAREGVLLDSDLLHLTNSLLTRR